MCSEVRFEQASPELSLKRVRFLRQCAGLNPDPGARTVPSILLVNRPFDDGRSILGLDDVADRVRRALSDEVNVRIFFARVDAGILDQASAFDQSTVVVAPHGAATANFNFLPQDAVALGVFALKGRFGHDEAVAAAMPTPTYNISVLPVDCTKATEARTIALNQHPNFMKLTNKDKVTLLMGSEMSRERSQQVQSLLDMSLLDWMDYRAYAPDPNELTKMILEAVKLWQQKIAARAA